jgi:hypothetical protein
MSRVPGNASIASLALLSPDPTFLRLPVTAARRLPRPSILLYSIFPSRFGIIARSTRAGLSAVASADACERIAQYSSSSTTQSIDTLNANHIFSSASIFLFC